MERENEVYMTYNHRGNNQKFKLEENGTIRCIDPKNINELVLGLIDSSLIKKKQKGGMDKAKKVGDKSKVLCLVRPHMNSVLIFDTPLQENTKWEPIIPKTLEEKIIDFSIENLQEWKDNNVQADQVGSQEKSGKGGARTFMLTLKSKTNENLKKIKNQCIIYRHGNDGDVIRQPERCNDAAKVLEEAQIYPKTLLNSEQCRIMAFGGVKCDLTNIDNLELLAQSLAKMHKTPTDWYESYKKETLKSDFFKEIDLSAYPNIDTSYLWVLNSREYF